MRSVSCCRRVEDVPLRIDTSLYAPVPFVDAPVAGCSPMSTRDESCGRGVETVETMFPERTVNRLLSAYGRLGLMGRSSVFGRSEGSPGGHSPDDAIDLLV